jgi:hypothetical protein
MAAVNYSRPVKRNVQCYLTKFFSTKPLHNERENIGKMLAWQISSYGDIKELELSNNAKIPFLSKPNDVLVKVSATSVNPIDVLMLGKVSPIVTINETLATFSNNEYQFIYVIILHV